MTRSLASIQLIESLRPIPGADAIEVARVLGWNVVVNKGEFKAGDKCVYFEVDSLMPVIPEFEFLASRGSKKMIVDGKEVEGYRLRTVKLRGQISQGLALPMESCFVTDVGFPIGTDVTNIFKIIKYEPPMPASLAGVAKGPFPAFIPKTDEMRLQSIPQIIKRWQNEVFYVTEKVDGSSCTIYVDKDFMLNVCSRNTNWLRESNNTYWQVATELDLLNDHKKEILKRFALQGELVGENIQGNKLKIKGHQFLLFGVYDMQEEQYVSFEQMKGIAFALGLETVPIIQDSFHLKHSVDEMVEYATGKSLINPETWAEGIVVRPRTERIDEDLGRLSFKVINPQFLLKEE